MRKKFTVVVNGRFHAFDYASELNKRGLLDKLISTMPYKIAKKYDIPKDRYAGFPYLEALKYIFRKLFLKELPINSYSKLFNYLAKKKINKSTDVIISFAGYSKEIFIENKNKIKILDRGSTHTLENIRLKKDAAKYHGTKFKGHNQKFIGREIYEYQNADYIMVPSDFVCKTFLKNKISRNKIIINPYAFSFAKFQAKLNMSRIKNKILFVGQISPRKGIKVLVDAFKLSYSLNPKLELWLVGPINGYDEKYLVHDGIKYYGVLKGKRLQEKFEQASLFILPSFEEGLALVLTEAKYFNLPIIATENTGISNLFDNKCDYTLFEVGNPISLSKKINYFFKNNINFNYKYEINDKTWSDFVNIILKKIK